MASLSSSMFLFKSPLLSPFNSPSQFNPSLLSPLAYCSNYKFPHPQSLIENQSTLGFYFGCGSYRRFSSGGNYSDEDDIHIGGDSFNEAVRLFNHRDYYKCHDILEALWNKAQEPTRTLIHGILQCAVGFHHLFNQNHRGAMMELGEGLCKLRKMNFDSGPFLQFEQEISSVLDFIYQTQLELAAWDELIGGEEEEILTEETKKEKGRIIRRGYSIIINS
ncbi:hypothetical protein NMG60_11001174 [Bertholletia excelsa]